MKLVGNSELVRITDKRATRFDTKGWFTILPMLTSLGNNGNRAGQHRPDRHNNKSANQGRDLTGAYLIPIHSDDAMFSKPDSLDCRAASPSGFPPSRE